MTDQVARQIKQFVGLQCWGVVAGAGTGSMATFDFGGRVAIKPPLANPHLTQELTTFQGEYGLFLEECHWQLESNSGILCTSDDSEIAIGQKLVAKLRGKRLSSGSVTDPSLDLDLFFEGGLRLCVLCQQTHRDTRNYSIRSPSGWITVGASGQVSFESA
jgi:hypothetical protein